MWRATCWLFCRSLITAGLNTVVGGAGTNTLSVTGSAREVVTAFIHCVYCTQVGLVDEVGGLSRATDVAKQLAGLPLQPEATITQEWPPR
jgi:hypothetical protein